MGEKSIYELLVTESGRAINTTGAYPYLTEGGWVKVSELKVGNSVAVPYYKEDNSSINSFVVNAGIKDCSLKCLSLDQIGSFNFDASAKYATSFESEILEENFLINFEYSDFFINRTFSLRELITELNSSSDLLDNSFLCLCSSINAKSGENNFNENLEKRELATLECLESANKTLASTTNFILDYTNFSFLSSSAMPLFTLLPISMHQSVNPISSSCLSLFNISSFQVNCLALDSMQALTNPDQLISGKFFICALVSPGTDNVIDTILFVEKHKDVELFKSFDSSECGKIASSQVFSGCNKNLLTQKLKSGEGNDINEGDLLDNSLINFEQSEENLNGIFFDKIVSIKQHPAQHVYDLEIENIHNFIANDIVAHNTYIYENLSMNNKFIKNLANGTSSQDAVTLGQLHAVMAKFKIKHS